MLAELDQTAVRLGLTRSELVRNAVAAYLAVDREALGRSFAARAADLAGSLDGPADLSTAAEYLEDFGR